MQKLKFYIISFFILAFILPIIFSQSKIDAFVSKAGHDQEIHANYEFKILTSGTSSISCGSSESTQKRTVGSRLSDKKWSRSKVVLTTIRKVDCTGTTKKYWNSKDSHDATATLEFTLRPSKGKKSGRLEYRYEVWIKRSK
jgi:hypothetical protein